MTCKSLHILFIFIGGIFLGACSSGPQICEGEGICTMAPKKATSKSYQIKGVWYHPQPHYEYEEEGIASYYGGGDVFHGRPTATGETFDMNGTTAAHKTLPLPCVAEITNLENGRQIQVKVNDRGPFIDGRIVDVSRRVAQLLGFEGKGTAKVKVRTLVAESLALNGLENPTVMLAHQTNLPKSVDPLPKAEPVLLAENYPSLPEDLFEEEENILSSKDLTAPDSSTLSSSSSHSGIFVHVEDHDYKKSNLLSQAMKGLSEIPVEHVRSSEGNPSVVRVGPFPSLSHANEALDQLADAGHVMTRIVIDR